jgi:hypothetical protein
MSETCILSESPTKKSRKTVEDSGTQKKYFLAVDIERTGPDFNHGILAIGVCFGKWNGEIIEQRAFCSPVPPSEKFDKKCFDEFWSKHPAVLERINKESSEEMIPKFHAWLVSLESKYGPFGRKFRESVVFKLVSDNPAYDIGMINLEFFKHGFSRSMAEMFSDYVPTDDPSEQVRGLTSGEKVSVYAAVTAEHDHWPANDATHIFQQRCAVEEVFISRGEGK